MEPETLQEQIDRLKSLGEGSTLSKEDAYALVTLLRRHTQLVNAIKVFDYNTRYAVSWLQAFIGHHRSPNFRKLPDLNEAEEFWKKSNDDNVRLCKELIDPPNSST